MSEDKQLSLSDVDKAVEKKYGKVMSVASDSRALEMARIRTGILAIDFVMGAGVPRGRTMIFDGQPSSGKSTTAALVVAAFQRHCRLCGLLRPCSCKKSVPMEAAMADAEGTWDNKWGKLLGVDLDHLRVVRAETAEQTIDISDALLRTGEIDVLVVDSIAALVPMAEVEESMEKSQMGLQARLINKAMRKWTASISSAQLDCEKRASIILINQIRYKVGMFFGNPETRPGGAGQNFASSIDVRFDTGKYHYVDDKGDEVPQKDARPEQKPAWVDISFESTKNKTFTNKIGGSFRLYLSATGKYSPGDVSESAQLWEYAKLFGLAEQSGKTWSCGKLTASSKPELQRALEESKEAQADLKEALLPRLLA